MMKDKFSLFILMLFVAFLLVRCDKPQSPERQQKVQADNPEPVLPVKKEEAPPAVQKQGGSSQKMAEVSIDGSTMIKGVVRFDGPAPKLREIKMDADPICLTHHTEAVLPQTLVLGDGQTMANVFVHVTKGVPRKDYPAPKEAAVLNQKGCMYDPHVLGVMVNQPVKILNPDGTLHNVHALPKVNDEFNLAMPKFRKETTQSFDKPEFMFPIKCDVHPWMGAWVSVMNHPFFAVTKEDGAFVIKGLPAGEYEISAWHEKLGTQTQSVVLAKGQTQAVDFIFARP